MGFSSVKMPKKLALKVAREIIQREHETNWETVNISVDVDRFEPTDKATEVSVYFSRYEKVVIK